MAIGLSDVKKANRSKVKSDSPESISTGAGAVSENWARTTKIARPWTTTSLTPRKTAPRPRTETPDTHMNEEWATDHTSSLRAFDMEAQSPLAQLSDLKIELKERAVELERKAKRAIASPFQILRSVLRAVQK